MRLAPFLLAVSNHCATALNPAFTRPASRYIPSPLLRPSGRAARASHIAQRTPDEPLPALPDKVEVRESQRRAIEINGETVTLDELGPIVLKEDGRLGRLSNWHEMTEHEQAATLKFVAKRNATRRKALLQSQSGKEGDELI
ncbi:hypothetical protein AB1Y20_006061 [Prymnesium parvum]|uniref:Uncharacterized protein n=1 Tax=Prymnesium parvum TaxID=97485 RepID=A0AB34J4V0_PRYPA